MGILKQFSVVIEQENAMASEKLFKAALDNILMSKDIL